MNGMEKLKDFKRELAVLLAKYDATLGVNVEGDTHGLSYEFVVDFGREDRHKEYRLNRDNYVDAYDLSK